MNILLVQNLTTGACSWIYAIILTCLAAQIFITVFVLKSFSTGLNLERLVSFSEWAINVPPSFGVLGTIVSLAAAIGAKGMQLEPSAFVAVFMQNFQAAVGTTILGGLVYAINLLLYSIVESVLGDRA